MYTVNQKIKFELSDLKMRGIELEDDRYKRIKKDLNMIVSTNNAPRGVIGGSLIDNHCNSAINQSPIQANAKNDTYPASKKERTILTNPPWDISSRQIELMHPFARKILIFMSKKGYTPIKSQVGVWHEALHLKTRAEQFWLNVHTQEIALVELKLGQDKTYHTGNGKMLPPFQKKTNCLKNQHQIQLLFEKRMTEFTFQVVIQEAMVLRITNAKTIRCYPLEPWVEKRWNEAVQRVREVTESIPDDDED